jgi:hypothetical protein
MKSFIQVTFTLDFTCTECKQPIYDEIALITYDSILNLYFFHWEGNITMLSEQVPLSLFLFYIRVGSNKNPGIIGLWTAIPQSTLIKNKIKFSSYIRKFRIEQLQGHIWLTASSCMGKYFRISSYIRKPFLIYDFATNCSILNFLIYEENLILFFISVHTQHCWKRYSIAYSKCQGFNSFWQNIFSLCRESKWYNVNPSPTEVSPNVFPWTMRPFGYVEVEKAAA